MSTAAKAPLLMLSRWFLRMLFSFCRLSYGSQQSGRRLAALPYTGHRRQRESVIGSTIVKGFAAGLRRLVSVLLGKRPGALNHAFFNKDWGLWTCSSVPDIHKQIPNNVDDIINNT